MKICARCKIGKDESGFSKAKSRKDGLNPYCKMCKSLESKRYNKDNREKCNEKLKKWRSKNPEKSKVYSKVDREKNHDKIVARRATKESREKIRKLSAEWHKKNKIRANENNRIWKSKNYLKVSAQRKIKNELKRGRMIRPKQCEKCLKDCKPDGHHRDYNKPLEVMWLCKICHSNEHGKLLDLKPKGIDELP